MASRWLDEAGASIDRLYQTMETADLRLLRQALLLDLEHDGDPDFIRARLVALDAILADRTLADEVRQRLRALPFWRH